MTTFLLVPGAGGDSWYWHLVVARLRSEGHEAIAVDLPAADEAAGLAEYADTLVAAGRDHAGLVLVAQSMGAYAATMACARLVGALLVLTAPMIPAPGESPGDWWAASGQDDAQRANDVREGRDPDAPFDAVETFLHDLPPEVLAAALERGEPRQAGAPFGQPWPLDAWPDVPTSVLAGRHDRLLPLEFIHELAGRRLGVIADVIDAGHLPALSRPAELAAWLQRE